MPVILLAHRDPQVRASLGSELTARGFDVIGVDTVDSALDAAAAGATALLVELALLAGEDMEVKTRLDLRSGRATRILALTHKASAEEMSMLKRHGAGLLSRPVQDIERMATMLRIIEEAPAPWEGSGPPPATPAPAVPEKGAKKPKSGKASPSGVSAPPPAPKASPSNVVAAPEANAPWDAAPPPPLPKASPVSPPATPSQSAFKPPPANFMPPDLSKSFTAATPAKEHEKEPTPAAVPAPLPPPPEVSAAIADVLEEEAFDDSATSISASLPPPVLRPAAPSPPLLASPFDDSPTAIASEAELPGKMPAPAPKAAAPKFELSSPEAPPPAVAPPLPAVVSPPPPVAVPSAPSPPPSTAASAGPLAWGDDTEDELEPPRLETNVFLDEPEELTNKLGIPGAAKADPLVDADVARGTAVTPMRGPKFEVEAEEGSTGAFAIPARAADSISPKPAPAPSPAVPPTSLVEESTQVIPGLAEQAIPAPPSANPFDPVERETSTSVPDLSNVAASISNDWFADSEAKRKEPVEPNGPSVLVVDDEPAFRTFLKDALGSQGYRVHTAINGPNALRFVKTTPGIDLVISDLHMPHMDGFELKHEIDKIIGRPMPFIVCTADANEEKIDVAVQVGAAALVPKPIENLDAFFAIVTDTLMDAGVIARTA